MILSTAAAIAHFPRIPLKGFPASGAIPQLFLSTTTAYFSELMTLISPPWENPLILLVTSQGINPTFGVNTMRNIFTSAALLGLVGSAQAAVPAAVTSAITDAGTDAATVAASVFVVIVGIFAVKLMRRGL